MLRLLGFGLKCFGLKFFCCLGLGFLGFGYKGFLGLGLRVLSKVLGVELRVLRFTASGFVFWA